MVPRGREERLGGGCQVPRVALHPHGCASRSCRRPCGSLRGHDMSFVLDDSSPSDGCCRRRKLRRALKSWAWCLELDGRMMEMELPAIDIWRCQRPLRAHHILSKLREHVRGRSLLGRNFCMQRVVCKKRSFSGGFPSFCKHTSKSQEPKVQELFSPESLDEQHLE